MNRVLLGKISRFAVIGVLNALVYAVATRLYTETFSIHAAAASGLGYVTAVPVAFFGHRQLTFKAKGALWPQFARLVCTHFLGFFMSVVVMWLVIDLLDMNIWVGIGITILAVPLVSYCLMSQWVFASDHVL